MRGFARRVGGKGGVGFEQKMQKLVGEMRSEEGQIEKVPMSRFEEARPKLIDKTIISDLPTFESTSSQPAVKEQAPVRLTKDQLKEIDIQIESKVERLTHYLNRASVCSRRQAENMIEQGMIRVNGRKVLRNIEIDPLKDKISIFTKKGEYFPTKENTKVWLFYKPMGMICTHKDPNGRPTIFEYIQKTGLIKEPFIISVGRLDYNSEGLILLTNDGTLARTLELPHHKLERVYRVRVFGRMTEEKLANIRKGAVIKGVQYGPFWCSVDKYQTKNTWLQVRLTQGKNREIRRVMQKNDLQVNRLKRLQYGPYTLGNMASGEIREDTIRPEIKRLLYLAGRSHLKRVEEGKDTEETVREKVEERLEGRLLDPLPLLREAKRIGRVGGEARRAGIEEKESE